MARNQLIAVLAFGTAATALLAADKAASPNTTPLPGAASPAPTRPFKLGPKQQKQASKAGPEVENVYKALEALTPEQQTRFKENFVRWINLSPDEKRAMRERDETRKKKMAEETQQALRESGLNLEPAQRGKFAKRYAEERRKLEERLRAEVEEKRKPQVAEIIAQLRTEFGGSGQVAATPTPSR